MSTLPANRTPIAHVNIAPAPRPVLITPRSNTALPGVPYQPVPPQHNGGGGAGSMEQRETEKTENSSAKTEAEKRFLWMPRKYGIPVAIAGVALLAFGAYKFLTAKKG